MLSIKYSFPVPQLRLLAGAGPHHGVWHNGAWTGTRSYILHYLSEPLSVVVLYNNEALDPQKIGDRVAALFLAEVKRE